MKGHGPALGSTQPLFDAGLNGLQMKAVVAAVIGIAILVVGALHDRTQFFMSYLTGYMFWGGMAFGFLLLLMLHNATGGSWGRPIRSYLEAGSRTVPFMAFFFIPLFFGVHSLYAWTREEVQRELEGWDTKGQYLNVHSWMMRAVLFLFIWSLFAFICKRWNTEKARLGEEEHGGVHTFSCMGLLLYFITMSFAAIDWFMSLEPEWFSSIFGVITIVGQGLSAFAFMVVFTYYVAGRRAEEVVPVKGLHDLGNYLLMSVMLWAYTSFSQYLLIWSGQIPEETSWLIHRSHGIWGWVGAILIFIHFFLPFFFLLFRAIKKRFGNLFVVALVLLAVHMLHDVWVVAPAFRSTGAAVTIWDFGAFLGLGGIFVTVFIAQLKSIGPTAITIAPVTMPTGGPQDKPGNLKPAGAH